MKKNAQADWIFRVIKGMFIGSGFILPGVSGGALAAVFGIYEKMISFLANLRKDFKENVLFFIPVGLGMAIGVFLLAFPIDILLKSAETYVMWFFIGCILGTLPALFKQAGKKGWKYWHIGLLVVVCASAYYLLLALQNANAATLPQGFFTWVIAGALIGLGVVVPGLSPSNLLLYIKIDQGGPLYEGMSSGIKNLDFGIIIPLIIGAAACVLLLSKVMNYVFSKAYSPLYHAILGFVIASTLIIVPTDVIYFSNWLPTKELLISLPVCVAGAALALFMTRLENKYKPGD